ncbi:MAG: fasciclin domain-containing protein [Hyphomicrobiaceae bacterium]
MRKFIIVAALTASSLFSGGAQSANIVETASQAGTFQTLIAAAKAAGLAEALSSGKQLTVFAPTDEAFAKLPEGTVESLLQPENKDKLAAILTYHVLPRELTSRQLPHKTITVRTIKPSGDRTLRVRKSRTGVTVDKANVVKADIKASNGVIHVIDSVMLPSR